MGIRQAASIVIFCLLLLLQPGMNPIQQLQLTPGEPPVFAAPLPLPKAERIVLPVRRLGATQDQLSLTAKSVLVVDLDSAAVLYEKNADEPLFPASITKIMTAMVALESYNMDDVIEIKEESEAIGSDMKLQKGERITVKSLLQGLLIKSANDAAFTLANNYPTGYAGFVRRMNEKAKELHMNNTNFTNVSGVEESDHKTTVRDILTLAREAMKNEFFRETVRTKYFTVTDVTGSIRHPFESTNKLLGNVFGIEGVKTGWTEQAGECLVTQVTRNGRTILTAMLNSTDRFGETEQLIEWVFRSHEWQTVTTP